MTIHQFLDTGYGSDGDQKLLRMLAEGVNPNDTAGPMGETALHVAVRRRRVDAARILLDHGAEINARTTGGKTAYAHAIRRGFDDVTSLLLEFDADTRLNDADRLAVAIVGHHLAEAQKVHAENAGAVRTGNPEEDRLLADIAGRNQTDAVSWLIETGADLAAPGMDGGSPLHQAAWFGQPENVRLLLEAGAPTDIFDPVHASSPIGWAVHGSRYSGGADERQDVYVALTRMLLEAGSALHYPGTPELDDYYQRLLNDASPRVGELLRNAR